MTDPSSSHPVFERLRQCEGFHEIPFTPVPVKPRHDGWSADRQRRFIDRLVLTGCVAFSARAVGKTPQSAYRLREHEKAGSFRRAWNKAIDSGEAYMLDLALDRALNGERVPIMRLGRCHGVRFRYDNRLAMRVLTLMDRRAERSRVRDPAALLERYLDLLDRQARPGGIEK